MRFIADNVGTFCFYFYTKAGLKICPFNTAAASEVAF
jgi:hypothetical protein